MQAACYEYFKEGGEAQILIAKNDKEVQKLKDAVALAGKKPFALPDFRARKGEDLRAYSTELYALLAALNHFANEASPKKVLIAPLRTLLHPLPSPKLLIRRTLSFGETLSLAKFKEELLHWGYTFVDVVESCGEVSFRGDIIDIFSIDASQPVRLSLFGDEIESIRYFACESQKSEKTELESVSILPALFGLDEASHTTVSSAVEKTSSDAFVKDMLSLGFWGLGELSVDYLSHFEARVAQKMDAEIAEVALFEETLDTARLLAIPALPEPKTYQDIEVSVPKTFLSFHQTKRITILARNEALLKHAELEGVGRFKESPLIVNIMSKEEIILSLNKPLAKKRLKRPSMILDELRVGDYVVHESYGVGIFKGLTNTTVLGATRDFVTILYQGEDKLLLPVENLHVIDRYISDGGGLAVLDKLGKGSFQKLKAKTREKLFEIAQEIIDIAAKRELVEGFCVDADHEAIALFRAQAGFEYTEDQERCIEEVFGDVRSGKVMDRLISGDVGFGKTEVAMNAILATVKSGYQAAFIAPTTLLSSQHFKSLNARFKDFGVRVAKLDRFTSTKERTSLLKGLAEGSIDVCIGTHALLGAPMKNQALLVIDEEHKFGVKQKEALKNMRANIHVLSMSATPIPRSLNMALSSIRQYSQILTPPKEREDVRTFVKEYDSVLVKEVVLREIRRGGQVFYVHNRIASIESKAKELREIIPSLRILVLHSHVSAAFTEKEMLRFEAGEYDVLLSTSIIESGIHLPNVNTMMIEASDHFGIADLHQLRGRVGRGARQGFCYFLVENKEALTDQAKKRLVALESNSFLGSGSVLAYHDLEIRGGGNLIGEAQSGHIKNIGYSLYLKMLEDAIGELMHHEKSEKKEIDLKLSISAYISPECVGEDRVRLELYRRLSHCKSVQEVYEIEEEMCDRFGSIDTPTKQFLELIVVKILGMACQVSSIANYQQSITVTFENATKEVLKAPSKDDDDILATTLGYLRKKEKR
ncbi:MAG: transcription-repair coupling factor [Campylobacterales bacterium]|nr:transcription-repair coupling factor [Campylobacterales bacterium]